MDNEFIQIEGKVQAIIDGTAFSDYVHPEFGIRMAVMILSEVDAVT